MLQQGIIEKVIVPSIKRKGSVKSTVNCFRLVTPDRPQDDGVIVQSAEIDEEEKDDVPGGLFFWSNCICTG